MRSSGFQFFALLSRTVAVTALGGLACASTWIVDINNGAGAHFTQLTAALAASQAGDVNIVRPGFYLAPSQAQAVNKGVTIIGQGAVGFAWNSGGFEVDGVPAGETLVVVNLDLPHFTARYSPGSITIRESQALDGVHVLACSDVRIQSMVAVVGSTLVEQFSRVEIANCTLRGRVGEGTHTFGAQAGPGEHGLEVHTGSRVHFARSSSYGGAGGDDTYGGGWGGDGGNGVYLDSSELWIDGGGAASIQGGLGGLGYWCFADGDSGAGVWNHNGALVRSAVSLLPTPAVSACVAPGPALGMSGTATDQIVTPDAPTLEMSGTPSGPGFITFRVNAAPGSAVRLNIGPTPVVLPGPGSLVEALLIKYRSFDLGTVPASGFVVKTLQVSAGWPQGYRQFAQARVVYPWNGQAPRTGSQLMVVR